MNRIVRQIKRGRSAGQWKAMFENFGMYTIIGNFQTKEMAEDSFDDFSIQTKEKKSEKPRKNAYEVKLTKEDWAAKSKAQIKLLSKMYP